jgi:hypothetical protein
MRPSLAAMWLIAAAAVPRLDGQAVDIDPAVRSELTRHLKFSANELSDLSRGRAVKHNLDSRAPGEFGVAGAIRIRATKAAFLAAARDIVHFKNDPGVLQIGRFSDPPSIEDLRGLTVDKDDFDAASCRLHDCGIRLPADLIRRARQEIDTRAPHAQDRAAAWFKGVLLADLAAYISGAPDRFLQYDDGDTPIRPVEDLEGVLANMPAIGALVTGLPDHLAKFPASRLPEAEDFFYWSKERFGVAPFISVTQVTIVCSAAHTCVMTTKDVYSSRYIDASIAVAIASDSGSAGDAFYLVYANRSRANALKGGLSVLRRSIVERRARGALDESLKTIKARLEAGRSGPDR